MRKKKTVGGRGDTRHSGKYSVSGGGKKKKIRKEGEKSRSCTWEKGSSSSKTGVPKRMKTGPLWEKKRKGRVPPGRGFRTPSPFCDPIA